MNSNKPLQDKIAIVTGASRGIGRAIALDLASKGCHIAGISRSESSAASITADVEAHGVRYQPHAANVASLDEVTATAEAILKEFENVDILVNNAGITRDTLLMRMSADDWSDVLNTNLTGAFNWTRALTRSMTRARSGRIINISSVIGEHGNAGQANYAAAKAGLLGLTKSVAKELAGRGITCNCICPGFIETDMTSELDESLRSRLLDQIPLKRFGTPEDVAALCSFLAGPSASYVTGQAWTVDGGLFV